ncbi:hypothetical protein Lesp02_52520 [Lentzea sp. NBRC 105346]|uniref:DUF1707 SHOCT-like domain-containing protein n=1 Tax=Lentzea sp. NBRC 105346 TaxID=3032205 RepID=UPI0024A421D6|nr:DUF1707 domain-containing protein [Lentzea sp. NBRC 105346]GLZ33064.1 hypothetical protein Lesp02_52520 [Lentzea sp. NBRC 105346]
MTEPRDLRVSDAEREHVVSLLNKAVGRGMITLDEFTARTDTALAAVTRADLNSVLIDLPGMVNTEIMPAAGRVELKNTMSTTTRKGRWSVPAELVINNRMGSTDLDFTEADVPPVVNIELNVTAGSVKLLVPEGATCNHDAVEVAAGDVKDKVGDGHGTPHFVLTGSVRAGSVLVKRKRHLFR